MASTGMSLLQILVRARGLDPVVVSAEHALRLRLGLEGRLISLRRGDLWEIEADAGDAALLVSRLVAATGLIVNPNRHRFVWRTVGTQGAEREWGGGALAAGAASRAFILVSVLGEESEEPLLPPLARALGERVVTRVERAQLWSMDLAVGMDAAAGVAAEAAVARSRPRGLLANPHYQRAAVHVGELPSLPLRGLFDGRVD